MNKLVMTATLTLIGSLSAALYASTVVCSRITPGTIPADQREKGESQVDLTDKIRALDSPDPRVRATAACGLRSAGKSAAAAIPALMKMLADDTPIGWIDCDREGRMRHGEGDSEDNTAGKEAALALAAIGDEAIEPLINHLRHPDWHARKNSAFALGLIKHPHTVEPLIDALRDASREVRAQAAWGLGLKHDQRVVEPLIGALRDGDWQVREKASWALGLQGDKRSVEPLSAALTDASDRVREQAAWALGLKGDSGSVEPLMSALRDQSPKVRSQAAWALGLKGDKRAVESLTGALRDQDPNVRSQAAWALGLKGDHRAVEALNAAMKDDDKQVRRQATWALGMILMRDPRSADVRIDIDIKKDGDEK